MAVDLSAFDRDDFDVKQWVNEAILAADGSKSADTSSTPASSDELPALIMRLQLLSQDASDAVEACMAQMLVSIPSTMVVLESMEADVAALREEFDRVVGQAEGAEGRQVDSQQYGYIDQLKTLDAIKVRDCLHTQAALFA